MRLAWTHSLESPWHVAVTPALSGDDLIFGIDPQGGPSPENEVLPAYVRAISGRSGKLRWQYDTVASLGERVLEPVLVVKDRVVVTTMRGLTCLDASTGKHLWTQKLKRPTGTPIALGDSIAVPDSNVLKLFDWQGKLVQKQSFKVRWIDALVEDGNSLFLATCAASAVLQVDKRTLALDKTFAVPGKWAVGMPPRFDGDAMLVNPWAGFFLCFDRTTAKIRWKKKKQPGRLGGCAVLENHCVVYSSPHLVSVESDGKLRWQIEEPIVHFVVIEPRVIAVTITADWAYELLEITLTNGAIESRQRVGKAPELSRDLWQKNGLVTANDTVYASHAPGAVFGFRR